jgi:hypothetical protein
LRLDGVSLQAAEYGEEMRNNKKIQKYKIILEG